MPEVTDLWSADGHGESPSPRPATSDLDAQSRMTGHRRDIERTRGGRRGVRAGLALIRSAVQHSDQRVRWTAELIEQLGARGLQPNRLFSLERPSAELRLIASRGIAEDVALKNPLSGRPGPTSMIRSGLSAQRVCILSTHRTVPEIWRVRRSIKPSRSPSHLTRGVRCHGSCCGIPVRGGVEQ